MQTGDSAMRGSAAHPGMRIGLIGLAVGAAWFAVSLFTGAQGASAARE